MADCYGVLAETKNKGSKKEMDEDFQEEDVWDVLMESEDSRYKEPKVKGKSTSSRVMMSSESQEIKMGPVDITGWPKHYKKGHRNASSYNGAGHHYYDDDIGDGDDDDGEIVPPHEYISKKLARTQIAFSMCEGVGRTLKGRDLSKLRNAILTKTGFLE